MAKELIDTQLELKHIEESCSPWNSPIFAIKKKSNKWHLLTDLRKVTASMKPMGALQPGIPSPTTIPQNWYIIIIDLQDCFFNIPSHPLDRGDLLSPSLTLITSDLVTGTSGLHLHRDDGFSRVSLRSQSPGACEETLP